MSSTLPCRLIVDPPQAGAWNMAVDEALLEEAASDGITSLRFYGWNKPTLSLGYFQKYADRELHPPSLNAEIVRRQSGGGAILHHHELTYSLALPPDHLLASNAQSLYNAIHLEIAAALRRNLPESVSPTSIRFADARPVGQKVLEPFLCFQRRSAGDLVFSSPRASVNHLDDKIVGSAQRRSRGAVLQHGSILLARSEFAPELAGLNDVCDNYVTTTFLKDELSVRLPLAVGLEIESRSLSNQTVARAAKLQSEKYGNRLWLQRR